MLILLTLLTAAPAAPLDSPDAPIMSEEPGAQAAAEPSAELVEEDPWAPQPQAEQSPPPEAAVRAQFDADLGPADTRKKRRQRGREASYARFESPQRFAIELKFGPYLPDVDRAYRGADPYGPYAKIFGLTDERGETIGAPKNVVMPVLGFEWQFFNPAELGPLALGLSGGFMRDSAKALFADPPSDPEAPLRSEADTISFTAIPLALQAVFRLEIIPDRLGIPLVPYAKGGLAYAIWWSRNADRKLSRSDSGDKALGGVWGWQVNFGGMLRLDFLDVGSTRNLDRTTGINHTYIFGEYQLSRINNFGRAGSLNLGDSTWFAGLAVEF